MKPSSKDNILSVAIIVSIAAVFAVFLFAFYMRAKEIRKCNSVCHPAGYMKECHSDHAECIGENGLYARPIK